MNQNTSIIVAVLAVLIIGVGAYVVLAQKTDDTDTLTVTNQSPIVTSGENPQPGGIHDMPVEPAAAEARKDLAAKLSVEEKSIVILQITDMTWNDGCLGLGGPAESCLQALVPGFRVEMLAKGKSYFYRTDKAGAVIRAERN